MSEVKKYRITGQIKKGKTLIPFSVEFRALKEEHAIQRLYSEMGSRHGARQFEITIKKIDETASSEDAKA